MYEDLFQMPFRICYRAAIPVGRVCDDIICNVDFALAFFDFAGQMSFDFAGQMSPNYMLGRSARKVLEGKIPADWPQLAYHRYWLHGAPDHNAYSHYGARNQRYKLIYWYNEGYDLLGTNRGGQDREWELFDCEKDRLELFNVVDDPAYADIRRALQAELDAKMAEIVDKPVH